MHLDSRTFVVPVTIALAFVLLTSIGWQAWHVWQQETRRNVSIGLAAKSANPATRQTPQISLSALGMFGSAESAIQSEEQNTENLPKTNLKLILRGVLAAEGDFPGSALVEDDRNNTEAYLLGDTLPGNATLRSVHPLRIVIERSGKRENLYFPETDSVGGLTAAGGETDNSGSATAPRGSASSSPQQMRPDATSPTNDQRQAEIRQRLEQLRQRMRDGG